VCWFTNSIIKFRIVGLDLMIWSQILSLALQILVLFTSMLYKTYGSLPALVWFQQTTSPDLPTHNCNWSTQKYTEYKPKIHKYIIPFDTELVSNVMFNLKCGKASDVDGLMAEHLLFCHPVVSVILCKFFQVTLLTRYFPTGFKRSYIVPVPKVKHPL